MIAGSHKSEKPINYTGIDKIHLKCDCIQGIIVNGTREPISCSFALSSTVINYTKKPRIKLFKKVNKSVLSHNIFHFEDDDHKPVDFNGATISFTCQIIKIKYSYFYDSHTHNYTTIYTKEILTIIFVLLIRYKYNYMIVL